MIKILAWSWFAVVQLITLAATALGWVLLIPFCFAHAWTDCPSTLTPGRTIDCWTWAPLNYVYGNPEDGVSGQHALLWNNTGMAKVPYMPDANPIWRAYCWSAWRNSADSLKYVFAWQNGPFYSCTYTAFGKQHKFRAGWQHENGIKVPVLS